MIATENIAASPAEPLLNQPARRLTWSVGLPMLLVLALLAGVSGSRALAEEAEAATGAGAEPTVETTPEGCTIRRYALPSPAMGRAIRVAVLLPPAYETEPDRRFDVIYGLHGGGAPYDTWVQMPPLRQELKLRPMIVVAFDGDKFGWFIDATQKPESRFRTFVLDELIPHIDATCRTTGRQAVTGFSMGGYGALHLVLVDPARFTSVSSLSGAFEHFGEGNGSPHGTLTELLGPFEAHEAEYARRQLGPRLARAAADGVALPPLLIHCGTADPLLAGNRRLRDRLIALNRQVAASLPPLDDIEDHRERRRQRQQLLDQRQIAFDYRESPGGHNWPFWRDASVGVADFHWRAFQAADRAD